MKIRKIILTVVTVLCAMLCALCFVACGDANTTLSGGNSGNSGNDTPGGNEGGNSDSTHTAHSYVTTVVDPTCTERGYTLHTCECGDSYKDTYVDAAGHTPRHILAHDATCTQDGNIEYWECTLCHVLFANEQCTQPITDTTINKLNHDYSEEWTIDVDPTTTTKGSKSHHCTRCEAKADITEIPVVPLSGYEITFNANGGKFVNNSSTVSQTASWGELLTMPETPTRMDHRFTGWYKDSSLRELWDFDSDTVMATVTLYADWEIYIVEYDVTFVLNYSGASNVTESTEDGFVTYIPTRTGYVFNGWWLSDGQTSSGYILSQKFDTSERVRQSGLVLYAEWVEESVYASQLSAPTVSIENGVFNWESVAGAQGYRVEVYKNDGTSMSNETVTGTSWTFPNGYEAGYYTIKIRANGDGIDTVNSAYITKSYANRILSAIDSVEFNITTSILTWSAVKNATSYELYINDTLAETLTYTTYDMSDYEAGNYSVRITATRAEYQSSTISRSIEKKRLKTPEITVTENSSDCSYTISWTAVVHADTYRIKHHDTYIIVNETSYTINNDSPIYNSNGMGEITVCAYDSNADYLISDDSESEVLIKIYTVTLNRSDNEAGMVSSAKYNYKVGESVTINAITYDGYTWLGWYDGEREITKELSYTFDMPIEHKTYIAKWTYYTLTLNVTEGGNVLCSASIFYIVNFNLNGGDESITSQRVTKTVGLIYPTIPTRSGYVFAGWYVNQNCTGDPFDFSATVTANITLYAKWLSYSGSGIINYNGSKSIAITSLISDNYYAFVPLVSNQISIYKDNNGITDISCYLYDSTKTLLTYDSASSNSHNFRINYNVTAGTLYYVRCISRSSMGTSTISISGAYPAVGGKVAENDPKSIITAGQSVTIMATTIDGYTWIGWYDGSRELTKSLNYTFIMPAKNITYTAKWIKVTSASCNFDAEARSGLDEICIMGESATGIMWAQSEYALISQCDSSRKNSDDGCAFVKYYTFSQIRIRQFLSA